MELSITLYTVSSIELLLGCSWIIIYIKKCLFEKNKERIIFHSLISRVTGGALFLQSAHCECQVEGWGHERRITVFRFAALFCGSAQPPIHSTNLEKTDDFCPFWPGFSWFFNCCKCIPRRAPTKFASPPKISARSANKGAEQSPALLGQPGPITVKIMGFDGHTHEKISREGKKIFFPKKPNPRLCSFST